MLVMMLSKTLCASLHRRDISGIQIWRIRWSLFLISCLWTVRLQAVVEWHVQCVQSPSHLTESTSICTSRLQSSMMFGSRN